MRKFFAVMLLSFFVLSGFICSDEGSWQEFSGTVVYMDLEGGFYGILAPGDRNLLPMNLDPSFKRDSLVISGEFRELENQTSVYQWGILVEVRNIQILKD